MGELNWERKTMLVYSWMFDFFASRTKTYSIGWLNLTFFLTRLSRGHYHNYAIIRPFNKVWIWRGLGLSVLLLWWVEYLEIFTVTVETSSFTSLEKEIHPSVSQLVSQSSQRPVTQPACQLASQSVSQSVSQRVSQAFSPSDSRSVSQSGIQSARQSVSQ